MANVYEIITQKILDRIEIAMRYDEGYLFVQEGASDDYFDYTIFNQEMIAVDGGQIDKTESVDNIGSVAKNLLEDLGVNIADAMEYVDIEEFKELVETANRISKLAEMIEER